MFRRIFPDRARHYLLIGVVLLIAGCGTMTADLSTIVEEDAGYEMDLTLTLTRAMVGIMTEDLDVEALREEGFDVEVREEGAATIITMSGKVTAEDQAAAMATVEADPTADEESFSGPPISVTVTEVDGAMEYRISMDFDDDEFGAGSESDDSGDGPDGVDTEGDSDADMGDLGALGDLGDLGDFGDAMTGAMMASVADSFQINWHLEAPGDIVDTNAETFEGNVADWHLNLLDMQETQEFYAVSRVPIKSGVCSGPRPVARS